MVLHVCAFVNEICGLKGQHSSLSFMQLLEQWIYHSNWNLNRVVGRLLLFTYTAVTDSCISEPHKARTACSGHKEIKIHSDLFPHWAPVLWTVRPLPFRCFSGILPRKQSNQTTLNPGFSASDFWHFRSGNSVLSGAALCTVGFLQQHLWPVATPSPTVTTKNVSNQVLPYKLGVGEPLPKTKAPQSNPHTQSFPPAF